MLLSCGEDKKDVLENTIKSFLQYMKRKGLEQILKLYEIDLYCFNLDRELVNK